MESTPFYSAAEDPAAELRYLSSPITHCALAALLTLCLNCPLSDLNPRLLAARCLLAQPLLQDYHKWLFFHAEQAALESSRDGKARDWEAGDLETGSLPCWKVSLWAPVFPPMKWRDRTRSSLEARLALAALALRSPDP